MSPIPCSFYFCFLFGNRVSCSFGCPQTHYVVEDDLEFMTLLTPSPECLNGRCLMLGLKPGASCTQGTCSSREAAFPSPRAPCPKGDKAGSWARRKRGGYQPALTSHTFPHLSSTGAQFPVAWWPLTCMPGDPNRTMTWSMRLSRDTNTGSW